ncbi:MAG: ribonuclease H-like domain-containing protein [Chloroflexota bacterium]|nr:MAG: ribonuclease H-like domain-containing protein [Chloroflexota bacterium]
MNLPLEAYLDIETTGLSSFYHAITVIGIYVVTGDDDRLVQLVGEEVTEDNLLKALVGVHTIYTYNGSRFDFPFIRTSIGVDLGEHYHHHDLMYDCWQHNLYGGLKGVEQQLGIFRQLEGIGGREAIMLWWRYYNYGDQNALTLLLQYNREDIVNLRVLREMLAKH